MKLLRMSAGEDECPALPRPDFAETHSCHVHVEAHCLLHCYWCLPLEASYYNFDHYYHYHFFFMRC